MTIFQRAQAARLVLAVAFGLASAGVSADMPRYAYACQALAAGGFPAYILVQADDHKEAETMAVRSRATTLDGFPAVSFKLVQCVRQADEKFRDSSFQERFDNLDL
jgi:hypothetical protein